MLQASVRADEMAMARSWQGIGQLVLLLGTISALSPSRVVSASQEKHEGDEDEGCDGGRDHNAGYCAAG
jgi:hypothetical protein